MEKSDGGWSPGPMPILSESDQDELDAYKEIFKNLSNPVTIGKVKIVMCDRLIAPLHSRFRKLEKNR